MRSETTAATLARLQADVVESARVFTAGRSALPALAMGSDSEAVVRIGIDASGNLVQFELLNGWRDVLPADQLGAALSEAFTHVAHVRLGDWAGAWESVTDRAGRGPGSEDQALGAPPPGAEPCGLPVWIDGERAAIDPQWVNAVDDARLRDEVLRAFGAPSLRAPWQQVRPAQAQELQRHAHSALLHGTAPLPAFLRTPVRSTLDRVDRDVAEALALPVVSHGSARGALRGFANDLQRCLYLARRPAAIPEAAQVWAEAATRLTQDLAPAREPRSIFGGLRRRRLDDR